MKLMVQSFNGTSYNAEEEETKFIDHRLAHRFNEPAEAFITIADATGSIAQKYRIDTEVDLDGGVADDGGVETDETTETNSAAANDMTLLPAVPVVNDAYYFGFDDQPGAMTINVGTAADPGVADDPVITWEYSQGSDVWAALAGVTDGTNNWLNAGENNVVWTIPGDWATDEVGSISGKYWVRARLSLIPGLDTVPIGTQAWYNKVWIGPGKVTIEDPDSTDIFFGRIMKATANTATNTVELYCLDWLSQLDEEQITYDMREDLDGNGLRESVLRSDVDGNRVAVENDGGTFYAYDDGDYDDDGGMAWANDLFNGMFLIFTDAMAGKKTWRFYPYDSTYTNADVETDDVEAVWVDNDTIDGGLANNDWELEYHFHVELGHNTPSDFYVHDSITGARLCIVWQIPLAAVGNHSHIEIYDNNLASYVELALLDEGDHRHRDTWTINLTNLPFVVDATGELDIRFNLDRTGGNITLTTYFIEVEIDVSTTGYSSPVTINDTINPNKLQVATDLTAAATQMWEGVPYCISREIYKHIDSAETPGDIITDGDDMETLTCAATIEHTSGISTRQYVDRTRLDILRDLTRQDKTEFWIPLGTTTVNWKSTWNDGVADETLSDTDVNAWFSSLDYATLANKVRVDGMRIGDQQLTSTYTDSTSAALYNATRGHVVHDTGMVSEYDTLAKATALATKQSNVQQILTAAIVGNVATAAHAKTILLGDEIQVTSSELGLSSAWYIVQRFEYDSKQNMSILLLHPRVSQTGLQSEQFTPIDREQQRKGQVDKFVPAPAEDTIT